MGITYANSAGSTSNDVGGHDELDENIKKFSERDARVGVAGDALPLR